MLTRAPMLMVAQNTHGYALHRQTESSLFLCAVWVCNTLRPKCSVVRKISYKSFGSFIFILIVCGAHEYEWVRCDVDLLLFFSSISCLWRFRRRCCLFLFLLLLSLLFKWVFFSKFRSNQQRRWIYRGARSFIWRWTRKILWISYKTNRFVGFSEMIRARPFRLDNSRRFGWKQSMQCMSVIVVFCALCRSSVRTQCKWHNPTLISAAMASETRRGESCSHSQTQQHARHRLLGIETMQFIQSVWGRFWKFVRVSQCHRAGNGLVSNIQTLTHTHHKFDSCCSVWCDRRILSYRRTQTSRLTTLFFSGLLFTMGGRRGGGGRKKSDTHFALHLQNSLFGFPIPQSLSKSERRLSPKPTTTTMTSTTSDKNGNHFVPGKIKCVLCSWILWKRKI